jgi:hypothetical protein
MGLANKVLKKIDNSETIKGMIADAFGKKVKTVDRWIEENDEMLTTIKALVIIERETGLTQSEILGINESAKH